MKKNTVSCIILNYNDVSTTIQLLEDIKHFTHLDYDNNSTDNSWKKLQSYKNEKNPFNSSNKKNSNINFDILRNSV